MVKVLIVVVVLIVLAAWVVYAGGAGAKALRRGQPAPDFRLPDQTGTLRSLADYRGHWLVLYFYPKDETPGCTTEACSFRDAVFGLQALGAQVLGVSVDSEGSHARFAEKYHLPFPLLADRDGTVARRYGVLWTFGPVKFAKRRTFIIDPQGNIAYVYRDVHPSEHAQQVIEELRRLKSATAG